MIERYYFYNCFQPEDRFFKKETTGKDAVLIETTTVDTLSEIQDYDQCLKYVVSVCLLYDKQRQIHSRGISILSGSDTFNLEEGKIQAKNKAIRGILNRPSKEIKNKWARFVLEKTRCPFVFSSEFLPVLSVFERKLLFGKNMHKIVTIYEIPDFEKMKELALERL